jgi:LPS sulfotransferase NodH
MNTSPKLSYFICCTPRSGSYLLAEALTNTGLAGRPAEYFTALLDPWHEGFRLEDFKAALQPIIDQGTESEIFGSKLMWPWFGDLLVKLAPLSRREGVSLADLVAEIFPDPHYIMLTRRDKVRQMISFGRAIWTNVWRSTEAQNQRGRVEDLRLDPRAIDEQAQAIYEAEALFAQYFAQYGITPFPVVYEDLVDRYEETAVEVLDFLGISHPANIEFGPRVLQRQWDAASDELLKQYYAAKGMSPIR